LKRKSPRRPPRASSIVSRPTTRHHGGDALVILIRRSLGADWFTWIYRGLATLLIACPCALMISTPAAIASALAAGAPGPAHQGGAAGTLRGRFGPAAWEKTGTRSRSAGERH
jgi:Cd2+/Zn2+-exporting ATPase